MAANGEKRNKAKRLATGTTNLRRVIVTIGRSDVQLSHSISVRRRRIEKDPKHYDVFGGCFNREGSLDMVCCMLYIITCCKLRVASCVLSADESIWLAREERKDNRLVSIKGTGVCYKRAHVRWALTFEEVLPRGFWYLQ